LLVLASCSRSRHVIERVEWAGAEGSTAMELTGEDIEGMCLDAFRGNSRFEVKGPGARPSGAGVRVSLSLDFAREVERPDRLGTYAEVGTSLTLRIRTPDGLSRHEVTGAGSVKLGGDSPDKRRTGMRRALAESLSQAVSLAGMELDALEKSEAKLTEELRSKDGRVREAALRALADRKAKVAVPGLIARLEDPDPDRVRWAIGALLEIGDRRAVSPLIDLMRGKDAAFSSELLFAIGALGGEEAQAYLYTVAQGHEQPSVRRAAQQALDELLARASHDSPRASATPLGPQHDVGAP
jgi:hypothetical protein